MTRGLLTGPSGVRKSGVDSALRAPGYRPVDLDDDAWSEEDSTGAWTWREDRLQALLGGDGPEALGVAGTAPNQGWVYRRFDQVNLPTAPREVILERRESRTNNRFGKSPGDRARVLGDLEGAEPRLRRSSKLEVDRSCPLEAVVDRIPQVTLGDDDDA